MNTGPVWLVLKETTPTQTYGSKQSAGDGALSFVRVLDSTRHGLDRAGHVSKETKVAGRPGNIVVSHTAVITKDIHCIDSRLV